jgi:hypothetical protein
LPSALKCQRVVGPTPVTPPWRADTIPGGYVVRDASGQALACLYSRENPDEARQAKVLTADEPRRIAANSATRVRHMPSRRFPPPWRAEPMPGGFVVRVASGQALAYHSRENPDEARQAKVLTADEPRRIADKSGTRPPMPRRLLIRPGRARLRCGSGVGPGLRAGGAWGGRDRCAR